jgi:hypothetical protein
MLPETINNDLELRINNWRLVFKDKPQYRKAGSLEGNYVEKLTKEQEEELKKQSQVFERRATPRPSLDLNDAIQVERAVISIPMKHKMVLTVSVMYPYLLYNDNFYKTCRIIGISRKTEVFDHFLQQSKHMLENILLKGA